MAQPKDPNPMPGYRRASRCPDCGAFDRVEFRRIGTYYVECSNCGTEGRFDEDEL